MTTEKEKEEALLRDRYIAASHPDPSELPIQDDESVQVIVRQANIQTGTRDLIVLAVTSFLALLLAFTGPLARMSDDSGSKIPTDGDKPDGDKSRKD